MSRRHRSRRRRGPRRPARPGRRARASPTPPRSGRTRRSRAGSGSPRTPPCCPTPPSSRPSRAPARRRPSRLFAQHRCDRSRCEWSLEVQLRGQARRPARDFYAPDFDDGGVGRDPRALQPGGARLRQADLHEHAVSVAPENRTRRASGTTTIPSAPTADLRGPRRLGGAARAPALRRRELRLLRLGQRQQVGYSEGSLTPAEFDVTPFLSRARTCSRSRSTATPTAATSRTRTCGG